MKRRLGELQTVACLLLAATTYLMLLRSFRYGFDLTDDAYYLYNLIYPRTETPISGFAWPIAWLGGSFGHHVIFYRGLSLALNFVATLYLVDACAAVLRSRAGLVLPRLVALSFALVLAGFQQAYLPTVGYNTVHMFGVTLVSGGVARLLASGADGQPRWWDLLAVSFGAACCLLARTLPGLAIIAGILLVVVPVVRGLELITRLRQALWLAGALVGAIPLALLMALTFGNLGGLLATQRIMMDVSGVGQYVETITGAIRMALAFLKRDFIAVTLLVGMVAAAFLVPARWVAAVVMSALLIFIGWHVLSRTGDWAIVGLVYVSAGLASAIAVWAITPFRDLRRKTSSRNAVGLLLLMLVVLPAIGSLGTSNNLATVLFMNLGPLGIAIVVPLSRPLASNGQEGEWRERSAPGRAGLAESLAVALLATIAFQVLWMREHYTYRVATPLSTTQTMPLDSPPELRGLLVAPDTHAHLDQLAKLAAHEGLSRREARALSIYHSPGSLLALGVPALGPPWVFAHINDAVLNCRLIGLAVPSAPRQLVILLHDPPREEILRCLADFGYGERGTWRSVGCVAKSTVVGRTRTAETCVFEAIRR